MESGKYAAIVLAVRQFFIIFQQIQNQFPQPKLKSSFSRLFKTLFHGLRMGRDFHFLLFSLFSSWEKYGQHVRFFVFHKKQNKNTRSHIWAVNEVGFKMDFSIFGLVEPKVIRGTKNVEFLFCKKSWIKGFWIFDVSRKKWLETRFGWLFLQIWVFIVQSSSTAHLKDFFLPF